MPGPVSDSYDPEWSTGHNAGLITDALDGVYEKLSTILKKKPPMYILNLVEADMPREITAVLTEKDWRLLRFAVERARDSI